MSHQDWSTVVVKRTDTSKIPKESVKKFTAGTNKQSAPTTNFKKLEESDSMTKPQTSTREMANIIQRARIDKKMTQDELNIACNFPKGTIAAYEKCTAIVNPSQTSKMSRILGVAIKNPPKPKSTE